MGAMRDLAVGSTRPATTTSAPALWRGSVVEVLATGLVWVRIPRMSGQDPIGPLQTAQPGLVIGDNVIVGAIGGDVNDLVVLHRL